MRYKTNFIGKQYGGYLVVASAGINKHHQQLVKCRLLNGSHKTLRASNLYRIKETKDDSSGNLQESS